MAIDRIVWVLLPPPLLTVIIIIMTVRIGEIMECSVVQSRVLQQPVKLIVGSFWPDSDELMFNVINYRASNRKPRGIEGHNQPDSEKSSEPLFV